MVLHPSTAPIVLKAQYIEGYSKVYPLSTTVVASDAGGELGQYRNAMVPASKWQTSQQGSFQLFPHHAEMLLKVVTPLVGNHEVMPETEVWLFCVTVVGMTVEVVYIPVTVFLSAASADSLGNLDTWEERQ